MSRKTICVKCAWNNGVRVKKNVFGKLDPVRDCGYFGTVARLGAGQEVRRLDAESSMTALMIGEGGALPETDKVGGSPRLVRPRSFYIWG